MTDSPSPVVTVGRYHAMEDAAKEAVRTLTDICQRQRASRFGMAPYDRLRFMAVIDQLQRAIDQKD